MWTGNKPPRIPVVTPTSSNDNNNSNLHGTAVKNNKVDAELEALKQRGLAKLLNRHFTETTSRLAKEKAAADEAVADLEERKARTSEFKETGITELGPTDKMAVAANQWRQECRRKERETILLYQRYVQKFGHMAALPFIPTVTPDDKHTSTPMSPRDRPQVDNTAVPNMKQQIETALDEYLKQGGLSFPSAQILGKDATFQSSAQKEEAEFRTFYMRKLEEQGVDAVASTPYRLACVDPFGRADPDLVQDNIDAAVEATSLLLPMEDVVEGNPDNDDECSVVSGLTTLHSAMTRELLQDCERSVVTFLREEQAEIRRIMDQDDSATSTASPAYTVGDVSLKATREAENMVQQMQEILHEYQGKQGSAPTTAKDMMATNNTAKSSRAPRHWPSANPDEEWVVYYDEFYQQEYYHEKHSNRTQWEPPDSKPSFTHQSQFSHEQVMPDAGFSRVASFRAKRRKSIRRRKFLRILAAILLALVGLVYYQLHQLPHVQNGSVTSTQAFLDIGRSQWNKVTGEEARILAMEQERKRLQAAAAAEKQRSLDLDALQESERLRAAAAALAEEEERRQQQQALMQRPWACNLPLSYLFHHRCRRLARQNPMYDVHSLIQSMLQ